MAPRSLTPAARCPPQFSERDAEAFDKYEDFLGKVREVVQPLLDGPPPNPFQGKARERLRAMSRLQDLVSIGLKNKEVLVPFYELFTGASRAVAQYGRPFSPPHWI